MSSIIQPGIGGWLEPRRKPAWTRPLLLPPHFLPEYTEASPHQESTHMAFSGVCSPLCSFSLGPHPLKPSQLFT